MERVRGLADTRVWKGGRTRYTYRPPLSLLQAGPGVKMGRALGRGLPGLDEQRVAMTGQREGGRDWTGRGRIRLGRQSPMDDGEGPEE